MTKKTKPKKKIRINEKALHAANYAFVMSKWSGIAALRAGILAYLKAKP